MSFADYGFAIWETFYVTVLSTAFSLVLGLPLGVLLVAGDKDGVLPLPGWLMHILNIVINILRSVPFLILMICVFPLTRGNSPSYGTTFQKMGHELLSRDELAVLDGGKCILQLRGVRPFLSDKYDLTQHPNYKLTSDYDPKNTFDIEKYLNRKEKINPNDEFVVIDAYSLPPA